LLESRSIRLGPGLLLVSRIVREISNGVQSAGVPVGNIVIYDRYEYEIDVGSYQALLPPGVRVVGIQDGWLTPATMLTFIARPLSSAMGERSYMASIVAHSLTKSSTFLQ